jgi:hypothetical protein
VAMINTQIVLRATLNGYCELDPENETVG